MNISKKIGLFVKNNKIELRTLFCLIIAILLSISIEIFTSTYSRITDAPSNQSNSRLEGNTLYVDDLAADYNYFKGLNHTEIRSTSIPSGNSTGYYDNDYLVKATIIYDGKDINNSSLVGTVSPINNENANKYIYYKYYALERNSNGTLATNSNGDNYIRIELIDNPFSKRPYVNSTEYGFNGWVCNQGSDTTANLCSNATMRFDEDIYTRYMDIPISNESEITIHLNASWYVADVVTSSGDISDFNSMSMQNTMTTTYTTETQTGYAYWNATYYTMRLTNTYSNREYMYYGDYYKTSSTSNTYTYVTRTTRCPRYSTCYVYDAVNNVITNNSQYTGGSVEFVPDYRANTSLTTVTINDYDSDYMNFVQNPNGPFTASIQIPHYHSYFNAGDNTSGFFYKVSNPTTAMINTQKYYNSNGTLCTNASSCTTAYKLIGYNDDTNNTNGHSISIAESVNGNDIDADKYYYLVTRDTNIFRYTSTTSLNVSNIEVNKPFTVTGTAINGTSSTGVLTLNSSDFTAANDIVIENIKIYGPNTAGTKNITAGNDSKTSNVIYANSHNLKIGRNVISSRNNDYLVAESVLGGTNSALSGTFKVIVESGKYYAYHSGVMSGSTSYTFNETTILGNDYDRVVTENKSKLKFLVGLDGYSGGRNTAGSDSLFASYTIFKSGLYGYNDDGTPNNDTTAGMYIGGYNGLIVNSLTGVKIEGGDITYVTGGYGYNGSETTNSTYIGMTGGTVRSIYGGAGYSTTKGNRIINVTGGTVSYSILGGSDSFSSNSTTDGVVDGDTLIYVGGTAYIGGGEGTVQGVEAGTVFGAGGGNSNSTQKGTVRNSHIIINGGTITNSVYGGGNYGSTGTQSSSAATTIIDIYSGNIGNVFGGSKSAGFSKSNYANSSTIDINVSGGNITNVYGGSNEKGQIYGSVDIDITGGTITNNVYGGGQGAQTFVSNNVDITIGTAGGGNVPTVTGSVYGGSALGTVNGDTASNNATSSTTKVTVKSGTVGNVFGGGQGDTSNTTPYVRGNVTVTVDGGTITNVYGGNDLKGTPSGTITVNINGGTITSAYAGGNQTAASEPRINVNGGTVTNAFGGGNNGTVTTSHISVTGGNITNAYGGGNNAAVTTSNLSLTGGTITNAFGGGNNAGVTTTNVNLNGSTCTNVFGGSNSSGTVTTSNVTIVSGTVTSAYGGNNQGGTTGTTHVTLNGGTVTTVYGGGEKTSVDTSTNVIINNSVGTVFGGSNTSGTVPISNVTITNGTVTNAFGGNNQGGSTGTTNVTTNGGTVTNVYGGGEKTNVTTSTNVNINSHVENVFGGSDSSGTITQSNVNMNLGGSATNVFGGNNLGGTTTTSNVNIRGSVIGNTYGGGLKATTTTSNVNLLYGYSKNIYGGGSEAGVTTTNVNIANGYADYIYGGSNKSGNITNSYIKNITSNVTTNNNLTAAITKSVSTINQTNATDIESSEKLTVAITNNTGVNLPTWDAYIITSDAIFDSNWSGTNVTEENGIFHADEVNQWYGTNPLNNGNTHQFEFNIHSTVSYDDFKIIGYIIIGEDASHNKYINYQFENNKYAEKILGGNNAGGVTSTSHINLTTGRYGSVYGGGEKAATGETNVTISSSTIETIVYGGGDQAQVNTDTNITINQNAQILGDVFGGGNEGKVAGDTNITINTATVTKNVYGGGNKAVVDGTTNINSNQATIGKNVYGGGNEAAIGEDTIVNLTNSTITENVYGGGNKANVAGDTNVTTTTTTVSGNIFGGGNEAHIEGNTNINLISSTIEGSTFGGGNNGMVFQNTTTKITNTEIDGSAHAGGNGQTATVIGNNKINVEGTTTVIDNHVFGGGNAAETGCNEDKEDNHGNIILTCLNPNSSTSIVNIAGGTINGNVYGGANTSVVYGETYVNIGINTITDNLTKGNIDIGGTVFGGGEANASGSEDYDFNFISVTEGINIHIDASSHTSFDIDGSIFGSGNASSSGGYSHVNIDNYGTINNPKKNVSIQRADTVTLNNSAIKLAGAKDRTNKYKNELFTLSRIEHLKLKNNSSLFLEKGANLLEKYSSLVDIEGQEHEATVTINENTGTVTKNVDNRIYMLEGKNLNISDDESLATYGDVIGMTFFGMFKIDRNGNIATGRYSSSYNYGSTISGSEQYYFSSGSYVVGKHKNNHNIEADGFYSNFPSEDGSKIVVDYIEPTPSDATYYRWVIGEAVEELEVNIVASKYSTLGTTELQLRDYYQPNTQIHILGVHFDDLSSDINLLDPDNIPRHAQTTNDANTNYGLAIKSGNTGWITRGTTSFQTVGQDMKGTTTYLAENSNAIPSFIFYLYHSKNLSETKNLGTVTISVMVVTPVDDLSNTIQRININVNLSTAYYEGDNYEAAISPGAQYEMFATTTTNITSKSTFSTYFSLYSPSNTTIYRTGYHRSIVSSYALPENTKITMIDFANSSKPEYYYYIIDSATYQSSVQTLATQNEVSYDLSNFIRMGSSSSNNTYNDATANSHYYDSTNHIAEEEFIFIIDLKDTNISQNVLEKSILLELRDSNDSPIIPVLDIAQQKMFYNLYTNKDAVISSTANLSNNSLYIGKSTDLNVVTTFNQQKIGNITIIDTNYYDQKLGIKISLYNSNNQLVNGASLLGTAFKYNGISYFPRQDGTVRFNIAESVANVSSKITIDSASSNLPSGEYKLVIDTFASSDGIYYGSNPTTRVEKNLTIVNEVFGLDATLPDTDVIIDKSTGFTEDEDNHVDFNIQYTSGLRNPNIRISMYRRTYTDVYDYTYNLVDIGDYVTNELTATNESKVYLIRELPNSTFRYTLLMKDNLMTGTYQIRFNLYDGNNYVGHINKYIIIE